MTDSQALAGRLTGPDQPWLDGLPSVIISLPNIHEHRRMIVNMDLLVFLTMIHFVSGEYEVVNQMSVPVPSPLVSVPRTETERRERSRNQPLVGISTGCVYGRGRARGALLSDPELLTFEHDH